MVNVKYMSCQDFRCLEDMSLASMELNLVHMGKEQCKPYHAISGERNEYILHFVISGNGFYSVNGTTYSVAAGEMFLISPHTPIVYCSDTNDPWSYMWVGFNGYRAEALLKQCGFEQSRLVLPAPSIEILSNCFDELFEHIEQDYADSLYRESILMKLLAILVSNRSEYLKQSGLHHLSSNSNKYLDAAIEYINMHYMQRINISDIANHVGVSQGYLNQIFTNHVKMSIQNYLIEFRMYKAANLLVGTEYSIKEISNMSGYQDQLVFSKTFKKKFNMSPKMYRTYRDSLS